MQIGHVKQFIEKQIDDDIEREKIKRSLELLQQQLVKKGMTLREVVDEHTKDLYAKADQTGIEIPAQLGAAGERSRARFINKDKGFDFVKILECSSTLKPIIKFQRKLKERSKRRHQKKLKMQQAARRAKSFGKTSQGDDD